MRARSRFLTSLGVAALALICATAGSGAQAVSTTTTLSPNPATAFTTSPNNAVVLTATVTGSGATGTVTFTDGSTTLTCAGGNPAALNSGTAPCVTSFSTEGIHPLSAIYSGDGTFSASAGTADVYTQNHATNQFTTYCNKGPISANGSSNLAYSNTSPYPSVIFVGDGVNTDLTAGVATLSVQLVELSSMNLGGFHVLLVSPDGTHGFDFWSNVGSGSADRASLTLIDTGAPVAQNQTLSSGSFRPTAYGPGTDLFTPGPPFPAPQLPSTFSYAPPFGTSTFASSFTGVLAHGAWSLYLWDGSGTSATANGGWCLNITPGPATPVVTPTATSVSGSPNPASFTSPSVSANVELTADVSVTDNSGLTVDAGTVTFTDGSITLGHSSVLNGQAILMTSLAEGTHHIVASYSGTDVGTLFNSSTAMFNQRVNNATTNPSSGTGMGSGPGPYTYCNTGAITVPGPGFASGTAAPYPSNIVVSNLPGTVNAVTVTLNGLSTNDQGDLLSLLVGPGGNNFEFFALTGSSVSNAPSPINLVFSDSSATFIAEGGGGNLFSSGTFRPTSYNTNIKYPQCPANASGCANPPVGPPLPSNPFTPTNKAPAAGTSVMGGANEAGVFGGTTSSTYNGNGMWSLYLDDGGPTSGHGEITNLTGGWCVNLTENLPSVGVSASHSGPGVSGNLVAGAQGSLTVDISNLGPSSTGDPTGGSNPLTVTDTLNAALTYTGFSGTGWNCSVAGGQTVTCKNDSAVAQGDSYGTLTLNVNVSSLVPSSFTNAVSVTGGGATPTTASDIVRVDAAAVLQVQKSHTGNFTAGQTAQWSINVTNEAANGSTFATISVSDTLPTGYTLASYTSTASAWSCIGTTTVTCTSSEAISAGSSSTITLTVNVPVNSPVSVTNTARAWGGGDLVHTSSGSATTGSDNATVNPAATPALAIAKSHSGTFTAGSTATWLLQVSNNGTTAAAATSGATVTVLDTLPAGFTLASFTGTGWSCAGTSTVTCTSTAVIAGGGANFPLISLTVNVPVSSPSSVSNVASVFGGGDVTNTSAGSAALSNTDTVSVTQAQPSPTAVSYKVLFGAQSFNLIGSARNRLPWEITAIQVVFSQPITTANVNSLTGVTTTSFVGLGTNTLTWSISPIPIGSYSTVLLASGANAIKGASGNALNAGTNFTQNFKVLWGDFNDDGVVDASDAVLVNAARSSAYNIFADVNGDGVVNATDVNVVRTRIGTSQP